jgi:hypothetical protein
MIPAVRYRTENINWLCHRRSVAKVKRSTKSALDALATEMLQRPTAASAHEAMNPEQEGKHRKLVLIHENSFYGYACSWCGCRLTKIDDASLGGNLSHVEKRLEKQFAAHVCSEYPQVKLGAISKSHAKA